MVAWVGLLVILVTGSQQHRLRITPVGCEGAMPRYVAVDGAVVLDGEDVFCTVFLVNGPVVDELIQQFVLSRLNHLVGIVDGFLIIRTLVGFALFAAGLSPYEIHL